ncbi:MAG TPA: urease accessory UreF family protein [Candidatus Dormibacteraeota bacterium]|nr:urease accessory UreF family protein [Candidatus Dormibacteraeota bacterium]
MDAGALLELLLLADTGMPTGAFTGSGGWESAARRGWLTGAAGVDAWLHGFVVDQLACLELPVVARAARAASPWSADRLLDRFAVVAEQRAESRRAGGRLLALAGHPRRPCHRAAATGWLAGRAGIGPLAACTAHAHATCLGHAQTAVRLGVIGGDDAIAVVRGLRATIAGAATRAASGRIRPSSAARLELAGLAHAAVDGALFSS